MARLDLAAHEGALASSSPASTPSATPKQQSVFVCASDPNYVDPEELKSHKNYRDLVRPPSPHPKSASKRPSGISSSPSPAKGTALYSAQLAALSAKFFKTESLNVKSEGNCKPNLSSPSVKGHSKSAVSLDQKKGVEDLSVRSAVGARSAVERFGPGHSLHLGLSFNRAQSAREADLEADQGESDAPPAAPFLIPKERKKSITKSILGCFSDPASK